MVKKISEYRSLVVAAYLELSCEKQVDGETCLVLLLASITIEGDPEFFARGEMTVSALGDCRCGRVLGE